MYELSIALKYLLPKRRSLATALISLLAILVISLVVWLAVVFLSVTSGIERNWLARLTTLHAPIRISPTPDYFRSYYYRIDSLSAASDYSLKSIGEKRLATLSDPYSASDRELPPDFPQGDGVDPVKTAFRELKGMGLTCQEYEMGAALLRLNRDGALLSQMTFLLSEQAENPHFSSLILEQAPMPGTAILLPKNFRDVGVKIGDTGALHYSGISGFSLQEHKLNVRVGGFYDPGLVSIGKTTAIVPAETLRSIQASSQIYSPDGTPSNGIFVWSEDLAKVPALKEEIAARFVAAGIDKYWQIETYRDFSFSKDLLQQFQSDKTLLLLIAAIILIVACSNIISLLVLLVNDKKREIAILQSMGASFTSIAAIFGVCGAALGALGSLLGSLLATLTLRHIDVMVSLLSKLQGHNAFNPLFFGQTLPNSLSSDALAFVLIATPLLSLAAGLIPAIKAARIQTAAALRSE